jgi:type II secretory pathway pseudopilin PulG
MRTPVPGRPPAQPVEGVCTDFGETLIELLVTITIMGLTVVAVLGAIGTSITLSDIHRKQAKAGAYVRAFAEAVETSVAKPQTGYTPCAGLPTYQSLYSVPAPFAATVTAVKFWNGATFAAGCSPDPGVQQVSLKVATSDNKVHETLDIIIRRPCRSLVDYPMDTQCT